MKRYMTRRKDKRRRVDPAAKQRVSDRDVFIAVISFLVGLLVSFLGLPTIHDVRWSNDKLLVKSVSDSHLPAVFAFPIELINTSRYPITNLTVTLIPEGPQIESNQVTSRYPIKIIEPMKAAPITVMAENAFGIGYTPEPDARFDMLVMLSGTYSFFRWKQHFDRTLYFIGLYEGNRTIHWIEQDASTRLPER